MRPTEDQGPRLGLCRAAKQRSRRRRRRLKLGGRRVRSVRASPRPPPPGRRLAGEAMGRGGLARARRSRQMDRGAAVKPRAGRRGARELVRRVGRVLRRADGVLAAPAAAGAVGRAGRGLAVARARSGARALPPAVAVGQLRGSPRELVAARAPSRADAPARPAVAGPAALVAVPRLAAAAGRCAAATPPSA